MEKRVMILGAGFEFCGLVEKAKKMGCYTVVCDGYPDAPAKALADKAYTIDVRHIDEIAETCKKERIDNVVASFSDILFECMIKISAKAGLPCYVEPKMLPAYREKTITKSICEKVGVKVPKFTQLKADFTDDQIQDFKFPCVIKPVDGYGSRGLSVVHSIDEVRERFAAADVFQQGTVLLEEYSRGQELNVMGFVVDGKVRILSVADRNTQIIWDNYIPVLYDVSYPSKFLDIVYDKVEDALNKFVSYTGQRSGPIATQCFWTGEEIEICEIAGRFFGLEHELVEYNNGLDIEQLLLDHRYAPERVAAQLKHHNAKGLHCSTGVYLHTIHDGIVCNQESIFNLAKLPAVKEFVPFYKVGDKVGRFGPKQYAVRYFLAANSSEEIDATERKILREINIQGEHGENLLWIPVLRHE